MPRRSMSTGRLTVRQHDDHACVTWIQIGVDSIQGMGDVDLHFHLLPGVDDGPAEMEDSIELARAAAAEGTDVVVVTPHVRRDFVTDVLALPQRIRELRQALAAAGVPLEVLCGGELGHDLVGDLDQRERMVASDAHGRERPPALALARAALIEHGASRFMAGALTRERPRRLLECGIPRRAALAA